MKSFKDYIELKEEAEYQEEILNEDPFIIAGAILGYAAAGLLIGWGGALLVTGYVKLTGKFVSSVKRIYAKLARKSIPATDIDQKMRTLKNDPKVKVQQNKIKEETNKYAEEFKEVAAAIRNKDAVAASASVKNLKLDEKLVNRLVIEEATRVFGEPPLHFGNTGNDCYLFVKKVTNIKVARAASLVVKKALEEHGSELIKGDD